MRSSTLLLTSTALLLCSSFLLADTASPTATTASAGKLPGVSERMKEFIDKNEIAGAVTMVVGRDRVLHLDATGKANVAQGTPMKPDAIFWIASMTKPVTATAILILQDEGKLSVDDPVGKYVPELAHLKTKDGKEPTVTLKHLLTHTSGMSEATQEESRNAKTLADLIPAFASKPLKFEPGSKWEYNQAGINTLGRIVEVVSGKSLPDFFQERIFGPLGMKDTTFYLAPEQVSRLATSYRQTDGKLEEAKVSVLYGREPTTRDRAPLANGGLFSTAPDYGRFCQMLLNKGTLDGKRILKSETVELMGSVQSGDVVTGFTPGNAWGLGVCVVREPQGVSAMLSPGTFGHGGAYGTQAWIDPKKGVAYVLMVQRANFRNSDDSEVRKAFQQAAADALGSRAEGR